MRSRTPQRLFVVLLVTSLFVAPFVGIGAVAAQESDSDDANGSSVDEVDGGDGNETEENSQSGNGSDTSVDVDGEVNVGDDPEPVDPYDEEYLNNSSTYADNNSSLGVHDREDMRENGGGMIYNAMIDVFLSIIGFVAGGLAKFIDIALNTAVKTVTHTPSPNWGSGYYQNPTNGIWPDRYAEWRNTVRPWTAFVTIMGTGIYAAFGPSGANVLPARFQRQGWKYILIAWFMTIFGWIFMAFLLNMFDWITMGIATEVTEVGIANNALKGVMLIGLVGVLIWNSWVFVVIISLVGFRSIGLTALAPWIPFFYALRAIPIQGLSMIGQGLTKLWYLLGFVAVPVSVALTIGFSPMSTELLVENGIQNGIQLLAMQLGTSIAALVIPYFMYQKSGQALASVGLAGSAPSASGMKQSYQNQRERAAEIKNSTAQKAHGMIDFERGARGAQPATDGGTAYQVGSTTRQKISTYSNSISERVEKIKGDSSPPVSGTDEDPWVGDTPGPNNSIDPETGSEIQRNLERYQPDDPELEELRQERLEEIRQRVSSIQSKQSTTTDNR